MNCVNDAKYWGFNIKQYHKKKSLLELFLYCLSNIITNTMKEGLFRHLNLLHLFWQIIPNTWCILLNFFFLTIEKTVWLWNVPTSPSIILKTCYQKYLSWPLNNTSFKFFMILHGLYKSHIYLLYMCNNSH